MSAFTELTDSFLHKIADLEVLFMGAFIVILVTALSVALFIEYQHLC